MLVTTRSEAQQFARDLAGADMQLAEYATSKHPDNFEHESIEAVSVIDTQVYFLTNKNVLYGYLLQGNRYYKFLEKEDCTKLLDKRAIIAGAETLLEPQLTWDEAAQKLSV